VAGIPLETFASRPDAGDAPGAIWLDLELAQWLPPDRLRELTLRRLRSLLRHARDQVPFHRERMAQAGLDPDGIRSLDDLARLPVLTKAEIQSQGEALVARGMAGGLRRDSTGGSTGQPLVFHRDAAAAAWIEQAALRFRRWMDYLPQDRIAFIWGADRDVPGSHPPHERWLNSFSMTPERIEAFARELVAFRPVSLRAYASSLHQVAAHIRAAGLKAPRPGAIESSAERLFPEQRRLVEEVFGCRVFDVYGSREVPALASECPRHEGLHVFSDLRIVEVVRDGRPARPGEEGALVVTDLVNYGMPFIRYEIGDVGAVLEAPCPCGRGFPRLSEVKGRIAGTITAPDGRLVHGEYFTHLFYGLKGVRSFRVHQLRDGRLDVLVVPGPGLEPSDLDQVARRAREHLGAAAEVGWRLVESIPLTPTGKHLFTLSDVPPRLAAAQGPAAPQAAAPPASRRAAPAAARPRILMVADVPDWIFAKHCRRLAEGLSDEFDFDLAYMGQPIDEARYDLVYPLEWNLVPEGLPRTPSRWVTGIRSHISWAGVDFLGLVDYLGRGFQRVHAVSRRLQRLFEPFLPATDYLTHGVDAEAFRPSRPVSARAGRLRVGWAGNKKSPAKGFEQFVAPLARLPGVELVTCGYGERNLGPREMREFYDSIDVYVCASSTEGNNNTLLEAAAMERAIVATEAGTAPEYLAHGQSALLVEREVPAFLAAVARLQADPRLRQALGPAARRAVVEGRWGWAHRLEEHRAFFRRALEAAGAARAGADGAGRAAAG
jgi:phenylacetate-CoA ligase